MTRPTYGAVSYGPPLFPEEVKAEPVHRATRLAAYQAFAAKHPGLAEYDQVTQEVVLALPRSISAALAADVCTMVNAFPAPGEA
jgi:hypothetical protein